MTSARKLLAVQAPPAFNPQTDITWHSLFWAEGSDFAALGYADTDPVTTWPNETGESDATEATNRPTYDASHASYGGAPVVNWSASTTKLVTANFSVNPTYPISIVVIGNSGSTANDLVIIDGNDIGNRNCIQNAGSGAANWQLFAGSVQRGGTKDTSPHLFVAAFDGSTGNESLTVDGSTVISGVNAGSNKIDGLTLGNYPPGGFSFVGNLALVGVYSGDITADGNYPAFKSWAADHYGITIA